MKCHQVLSTLEELTLPQLRAKKHPGLRQHVHRCAHCRPHWERWWQHEQQLASFLALRQSPPDLWERILAAIAGAEASDSETAWQQRFTVETSPYGVRRLSLDAPTEAARSESAAGQSLATRVHAQLAEYLRGERTIFQLPVDLRQCSDFERAVLATTATIPYGEVRSYKWIAARIGHPRAMRAVGNALHRNPLPILIPCHRVIKSDGRTGGYAFGEAWKTRLLSLEQATTPFVGCSSTRILCYRGCHHERRIRQGNRIHFAQAGEALHHGYRPCTICQPGAGRA
jgi:O-6-methylguanine DNA methyltransferase